jgi:hypothetical protein
VTRPGVEPDGAVWALARLRSMKRFGDDGDVTGIRTPAAFAVLKGEDTAADALIAADTARINQQKWARLRGHSG